MPKKFEPGYQPKGHGPAARKMFPISMRLTEEARDQLARAAEASGRSLAAETEHRLARSFSADEHMKDLMARIRALEAALSSDRETIANMAFALRAKFDPADVGASPPDEDIEWARKGRGRK